MGPTIFSFYLMVEMGLLLVVRTSPAIHKKKHQQNCLKSYKLCLAPFKTSAGFLIDTKMKADTKMTVVIGIHIFDRKFDATVFV